MVAELVEDESLRAILDRGALPVRKAIDIGVQIAEALAGVYCEGPEQRHK
jgi:hypothetical protein